MTKLLRGEFLWERRVPLRSHDKRGANNNQEKRKELAARERPD
jgi:hypothetical protein